MRFIKYFKIDYIMILYLEQVSILHKKEPLPMYSDTSIHSIIMLLK